MDNGREITYAYRLFLARFPMTTQTIIQLGYSSIYRQISVGPGSHPKQIPLVQSYEYLLSIFIPVYILFSILPILSTVVGIRALRHQFIYEENSFLFLPFTCDIIVNYISVRACVCVCMYV